MDPSDKKPTQTGKKWFWDILHRADSHDSGSGPHITFRASEVPEEQVSQQWERLAQQLSETPTDSEADRSLNDRFRTGKARTGKTWLLFTRVAASVVFLMLVAGGFWAYQTYATHSYITRYGETARIKLPDGSLVTLNAHSRLSFRNWQEGKNREVWLEGEAFFEVQKIKRPAGAVKFTVHTNDLNVEVLGTRFNVSDRSSKTQVVLEEGKIRLRLNQEANSVIEMRPGELIELSEQQPAPLKRDVNPQNYTGWKDDQLVLNGKSLREVADIITENYGVEVQIRDLDRKESRMESIANLQLQGSIPAHNLDELVEALTLAAGVKIKRESNRLILTNP